jgi:mRNA interferase MazF
MIDFKERGVQFAEKAPEGIVTQVLAKVRAIVSE